MSGEPIKLTEAKLDQSETLLVEKKPIGGWMAWAKQSGSWNQLFPIKPKANWFLTPGCLFFSRDDAIRQAMENSAEATELKLFYVELEK